MRKLIFLFLFSQILFSQNNKLSLEDKIYNEIDILVANPKEESLTNLEIFEQKIHPKTKAEIIALFTLEYNVAYYQNQFGHTQKAISNYENAWRLYQKNNLIKYEIIESCLKPLGNLYTIIGDYENAENIIKHYYYIATIQKKNPKASEQKYAALLNLSNVYQNTGRIYESIELLEKTINTEKLTSTQKGILWNNLGNNYFLSSPNSLIKENPYRKGEDAYKKAITLLKLDKNQSEPLSNAYRNLAKRYAATEQYELANSTMEKAKIAFKLLPNLEIRKKAQFYYDEAYLLFKQEKIKQASVVLSMVYKTLIPNYSDRKKTLPKATSLYAETTLLDALDLQAEIYLNQKLPKKALESYLLSFHIEELFQSLVTYENSKIINQIRNRNRAEKCLDIYYILYQKEKKTSYIESALLLQEQTKSAVLKQALSQNKTISREGKIILEQLQNWSNTIIKEQQKGNYADIVKITEAIKKQNELMLLLKSNKENASKTTKLNFDIKELYSKLKKDKAVMVNYFFGTNRIYIFTVEQNTIRLEFINNGDTATPKIVQFIDFFSNSNTISNNPSEYNHYSNVAYKTLKLPTNKFNKNLIIIPDGVLTFLPFEALITEESSSTNFSKMHYLMNDFAIGYNNSASFYVNSVPFLHTKESVLGVFPIFENSALELTFSKKELENLKSKFEGKYLERQKATFKNFKNYSSNYSILHLSTHASSGDIMEPASIKFYDQELLYSELYNLNINPDLVVLSACETGLGKLYKAEGAMSIARGFQFAGAQNLMFSLWKVNDFTTSVLMEKFYKNVKSGKSYFDSNHQAKLDFLKDSSIPNAKKSPYYWSAFVYYGTLENKSSPINYLLWISIIIGLITLFLAIKFKNKHSK